MKIKLVFAYALVCITGCTIDNTWQSPPPSSFKESANWQPVVYCEIGEQQAARYVRELGDRPFVEVTPSDAKELCRRKLNTELASKFYVVRALYIGKGTGAYSVRADGSSIWIDHQSLAGRNTPRTEDALLVAPSIEPGNIYVTAYADEQDVVLVINGSGKPFFTLEHYFDAA